MRKQFNLQDWLKDKSQKVETMDGSHVVETISVDLTRDSMRVMANFGNNRIVHYYDDGRFWENANSDSDLFIVTPEEELTDFEDAFGRAMMEAPEPEEKDEWYPYIKESAAELLDLARKELTLSGNIVLSVEEFEKKYVEAIKMGKAAALKDLPRWKKAKEYMKLGPNDFVFTLDSDGKCSPYWDTEVEEGQFYIAESDLENLPKED